MTSPVPSPTPDAQTLATLTRFWAESLRLPPDLVTPDTDLFANGADSIQLLDPQGLLVDAVLYDDGIFWPDTAGKSLSLDRALVDVISNDDGDNWCVGITTISASNADCATPRRANTVCP